MTASFFTTQPHTQRKNITLYHLVHATPGRLGVNQTSMFYGCEDVL